MSNRPSKEEKDKLGQTRVIAMGVSIDISGDRAASDPRDYIYALLGLVEPQTNLFEPDYSRSEFWAYQQATVHIARCRQDLYFLFLRSGQQITSEPSRPAQSGRMVSRARL